MSDFKYRDDISMTSEAHEYVAELVAEIEKLKQENAELKSRFGHLLAERHHEVDDFYRDEK